MKRNGQAMIWGIGMLLVAFAMTLFVDGYVNTRYAYVNAPNVSYVYVNNTLIQRISGDNVTNITGGNATVPSGDYRLDVKCQGGRCVHTYVQTTTKPILGLVEIIIGSILAMFAILSFYMAHRIR